MSSLESRINKMMLVGSLGGLLTACRTPLRKETGGIDTGDTGVDTGETGGIDTGETGGVDTGDSGVDTGTIPETTVVTIEGRDILVNGEKFIIKGVGYHPNPIGTSVVEYPYGDYFTSEYHEIYERDIPNLKDLGANTIRLWGWDPSVRSEILLDQQAAKYCNFLPQSDHSDFLNQLHEAGIYVIAGLWVEPYSVWDEDYREEIKQDFIEMVENNKDSNAILMWALGNEVTYNNPSYKDVWYTLLEEAAQAAHEIEGENYHPVTTVNLTSDLISPDLSLEEIAEYNQQVPSLDVWGVNSYWQIQGVDPPYLSELFTGYEAASEKPLWIAEWGVDAYNNLAGEEDEETQASYNGILWDEIASSLVCSGGTVMEYSDEWWKDWSGVSYSVHDTGGYATLAQPDSYANEEWWGLTRVYDNGSNLDILEPRQAYYELQERWSK